MQHGSAEEMQRQFAYVAELIEKHNEKTSTHGSCVVVEVRPRDASAPPSFRFPDRDVRTLFDMQRDVYPASLYSTTHFCGLPRAVTWAFKLVKPFMRREAYNSMVLRPSFAHLPGAMPASSMLRSWGGTLDFDIDAWIEWRAVQEGLAPSDLCARGHGRRFDPKATAAASADAMDLGASHISASALIAGEVGSAGRPPRLYGQVEKRGSGRGLFGTVRWKPKLLAVSEVGVVYFDGLDVDAKNKAARLLPLGEEGTIVELRGEVSGGAGAAHCFALVAPSREFLFGVPTAEKAAEWVGAIQAEIDAAQATRREMSLEVDETASTMEAVSIS